VWGLNVKGKPSDGVKAATGTCGITVKYRAVVLVHVGGFFARVQISRSSARGTSGVREENIRKKQGQKSVKARQTHNGY